MEFRSVKSVALIATLALALSAGSVGCGPKTASEEAIVAEVGGRPIKLREVTDYVTSLSMDFPTASEELAVRQRKLDRLLEDKLLVIGGYARTLDADISILEAVDAEKEKFLDS